jgi:hypothetical protein
MSDGTVDLEFLLRTQQAEAAIGGLDAKVEHLKATAAQAAKGMGGVGAETEKADRSLKNFAASMNRQTATPFEKMTEGIKKSDAALKATLMTQEQHSRAVIRLKTEYEAATSAADKLGETEQKANGPGIVDMIGQKVVAVASISAAVGVAKQAWEAYREVQREALAEAHRMDEPNKDLAQLADPNKPGDFQRLQASRDELAVNFGLNRAETTDLVFNANSAGLSEKQTEYAARTGLIGDASDTALLMGKVKEIFGEKIKPEEAIAVSLQTAAQSPLNFKDVVAKMPSALGSANELGLSFEDTAGTIGEMAKRTGTPSEAYDRYTNLAGKMAREDRFKGRGLDAFEDVINMSKEDQEKTFGKDKETDEAIRALRSAGIGQLRSVSAGLTETKAKVGTSEDPLSRIAAAKLADPVERAKFLETSSQVSKQVAAEKEYASPEAARNQAFNEEQERITESGRWLPARAGAYMLGGLATRAGMSPEMIRSASRFGENWLDVRAAAGGVYQAGYNAVSAVSQGSTDQAKGKTADGEAIETAVGKVEKILEKIDTKLGSKPSPLQNSPEPK